MKLGVCVHYPNSNSYCQRRQFKMHDFLELCPFFDLDFLSTIKHPRAEHWHPHALLFLTMYSLWLEDYLPLNFKNISEISHSVKALAKCQVTFSERANLIKIIVQNIYINNNLLVLIIMLDMLGYKAGHFDEV